MRHRQSTMTTVRMLLAGLIAALGLVAITASPSQACSCALGGVADFANRSDAVFTGTLVEVRMPPERRIISSADPVTYVFDVDRVYAGEVGATAEVTTARFGASCGWERMRLSTSYVVFADDGDRGLSSSLCSGTGRERPRLVHDVEGLLGSGTTPSIAAEATPEAVLAALLGWLGWG